jgi:hypothetical protein
VTNFWDPEISQNNTELEQIQGRLLADVAEEQGVEVYIWSSLPDVKTITKGKLNVPHFTGKNLVEQYLASYPTRSLYQDIFVTKRNSKVFSSMLVVIPPTLTALPKLP